MILPQAPAHCAITEIAQVARVEGKGWRRCCGCLDALLRGMGDFGWFEWMKRVELVVVDTQKHAVGGWQALQYITIGYSPCSPHS